MSSLASFSSAPSVSFGMNQLSLIDEAALKKRAPRGIWLSPYPFVWNWNHSDYHLTRYALNVLTSGAFSYINPNQDSMKLLKKHGTIQRGKEGFVSEIKVLCLPDIMSKKSGFAPKRDSQLTKLMESADCILANLEGCVLNTDEVVKRSLFSANLKMNKSFLQDLFEGVKAPLILNIANNHLFDTSRKSEQDVEGVLETINAVQSALPNAQLIGAEIGEAKSVATIEVKNGPRLAFVGATELMNHDHTHYLKKVIKESDLTGEALATIRKEHDICIGTLHGHEEHSYTPLEAVRQRSVAFLDPKMGLDLLWMHSTHVPMPSEEVNNCLLFHGGGNFCHSSLLGAPHTQIGYAAEVVFCYEQQHVSAMDYHIHLFEQTEDSISLLKPHQESLYPDAIARLKTSWPSLFDSSSKLKTE